MDMMNQRIIIGINLIGLVTVLYVNYLAVALPINGRTPGELSDLYPNYFVPAGRTFAIWSVIYTWLLVWAAFQIVALFSQSVAQKMQPNLQKTGWLFLANCLLNIGWLLNWHYQMLGASVAIMVLLLQNLVRINLSLGVGQAGVSNFERWLVHIPFGIYQGWITVALIANVTAFLVDKGWLLGGTAEPYIAAGMVALGALLAVFFLLKQRNYGHGAAVAWALFGIYTKQNGLEGADHALVANVALGCMILVLGTGIGLLIRKSA
jgi:translocator protein